MTPLLMSAAVHACATVETGQRHCTQLLGSNLKRASKPQPVVTGGRAPFCPAGPARGCRCADHDVVDGVALAQALVRPRAKEQPVALEADVLAALLREAVRVEAVRLREALPRATGGGSVGAQRRGFLHRRFGRAAQRPHRGGAAAAALTWKEASKTEGKTMVPLGTV